VQALSSNPSTAKKKKEIKKKREKAVICKEAGCYSKGRA
jgi:hypothetical protein